MRTALEGAACAAFQTMVMCNAKKNQRTNVKKATAQPTFRSSRRKFISISDRPEDTEGEKT